MAQMVKNQPAMQETWVQSLGREDRLEKGMATHSSILAWRIPRSEEPGEHSPWSHKESDMTGQLKHTCCKEDTVSGPVPSKKMHKTLREQQCRVSNAGLSPCLRWLLKTLLRGGSRCLGLEAYVRLYSSPFRIQEVSICQGSVISSVLSRHNKDLKRRMIKPSAHHSS